MQYEPFGRIAVKMSPTPNSTGNGSLWAKICGGMYVDRCKPNCSTIWERQGAVVRKKKSCRYLQPLENNAGTRQTEIERQTVSDRDQRTVTANAAGEIRCR